MNLGLDLGWVRPSWQVHDMDDDGDQDILFVDVRDDATSDLNWLVNNGTGYYDSLVVLLEGPEAFELTDLDMDGQEDLLAISTSTRLRNRLVPRLGSQCLLQRQQPGYGSVRA